MDNEKILKDTMEILEKFFFIQYQNSNQKMQTESYDGFYFMSKETGDRLRQQLIKYKFK